MLLKQFPIVPPSLLKIAGMPLGYLFLRARTELYRKSMLRKYYSKGRNYRSIVGSRLSRDVFFKASSATLGKRNLFFNQFTPEKLEDFPPAKIAEYIERAENIFSVGFKLFGINITIEPLKPIDWCLDPRSGFRWDSRYYSSYDHLSLEKSCDIKFPWELSRLQWLIPVGQAYHLTKNERYAAWLRSILEDWIKSNPIGWSVNWACTMEVSIRLVSLIWLFEICGSSIQWRRDGFRDLVFKEIYFHLEFVNDNYEITDINGNHLIAGLTALIIGASFLDIEKTRKWRVCAQKVLLRELKRQILSDGVNFEGSFAYHRLVGEMLLACALTFKFQDFGHKNYYQELRSPLLKIAAFIESYTPPCGRCPVLGDNDNGRLVAYGTQSVLEHGYLPILIRCCYSEEAVLCPEVFFSECMWWNVNVKLDSVIKYDFNSAAFNSSGFYFLKSNVDYVCIRCGKLSFAGRGGHSHNDSLSLVVTLDQVSLFVDAGISCYTSDPELRDLWRSTASHNTPQIDHNEIKGFRGMWGLRNDSDARVDYWTDDMEGTHFFGSHDGLGEDYDRWSVSREVFLDKENHNLYWIDQAKSANSFRFKSPLLLHPDVSVDLIDDSSLKLRSGSRAFRLSWRSTSPISIGVEASEVSFSYGEKTQTKRIYFYLNNVSSASIACRVEPIRGV